MLRGYLVGAVPLLEVLVGAFHAGAKPLALGTATAALRDGHARLMVYRVGCLPCFLRHRAFARDVFPPEVHTSSAVEKTRDSGRRARFLPTAGTPRFGLSRGRHQFMEAPG